MHRLHALWKRRNAVHLFIELVVNMLRDVVEAGKPLPKPFAVCDTFEPDPESVDPDADEDQKKWAADRHYDCLHCKDTIRIIGMTREELFDRYGAAWNAAHPVHEHADERMCFSRATPATDGELLWYATGAGFGHHGSGLSLEEVKLEDAEEFEPGFVRGALFYFRRGADLDASAMRDALKVAEERRKQLWAQREQDRLAKREKDEVDRIEATVRFFTERA